jgi:hypothetical protein
MVVNKGLTFTPDMIGYTDIMINNTNKKDTMKTETIQNFILRGGKLQIVPSQKSKNKHIVKCSPKYNTRISWQKLSSMYRKAA